MKKLLIFASLLLTPYLANAEMVLNDSIGNDPAKEKLCESRAKGKAVPFEIDSSYVERERLNQPDATFIAIDGISPQLIECYLRQGTGRFEPASMSPEQSYWHTIKPKGFEPGINTDEGRNMAAKVCLEKFLAKSNRPDLDHSVNYNVAEVGINGNRALIAGKKAKRYDILATGTAFYKSKPDLTAVKFTCLLSPSLKVKAIQFK